MGKILAIFAARMLVGLIAPEGFEASETTFIERINKNKIIPWSNILKLHLKTYIFTKVLPGVGTASGTELTWNLDIFLTGEEEMSPSPSFIS